MQSYYTILSKHNKSKKYRNFYIEDLPTHILIMSDTLVYSADIPDIIHSIIYGYHPNKSLNIILQRFRQATWRDSVTRYIIILIKDWYKGALIDIALLKQKSQKPTAPLSTRLSYNFITTKIVIQENRAADFTSDLALFITINSNVIL